MVQMAATLAYGAGASRCATSSNRGYGIESWREPDSTGVGSTRVSGSRTGSRLSISASTAANIAVLAPMPSPSDAIATTANPGLRASKRRLYRRSRIRSRTTAGHRSRSMSRLGQPHHEGDGDREPCPALGFTIQVPAPRARQRIELRPAVVLRRPPLRFDPPLLLQLVQRGIERAVAHLQHIVRDLLQPLADRPAVQRFERQDLEDQQVQGPLNQVGWLAHLVNREENTPLPLGYQEVGQKQVGRTENLVIW